MSSSSFKSKITISRTKIAGLMVILAFPALAVLSVFGSRTETVAETEEIRVTLDHPLRTRSGLSEHFEIEIENISGRPMRNLVIKFAPEYLKKFSILSGHHQMSTGFTVQFENLSAGEKGISVIDVKAKGTGLLKGDLKIFESGQLVQMIKLKTLVFP